LTVDNSYPTPELADHMSGHELRNAYARLYRHADNLATLVAALRADLAAVRAARDEWPGERTQYRTDADDSLVPVCADCGKPGKLITTPGGARVCRDCYMGENYQER
jgi:hypothetical protein